MGYLNEAQGASPGSPATTDYVATQAVSSTATTTQSMAAPLLMLNQSQAPAAVAGGALIYVLGGVLTYVNPQGLAQTLVGSQSGLVTAGITTVASTASETALQTMSLPANDAIAGAVYRQVGWGVYSTTGTPTLAFGSRLGGVAGTSLATIAATTLGTVTTVGFKYEIFLNFLSTTTAQCLFELDLGTSSSTNAVTPLLGTPAAATTVAITSTKAWVVTVTWGTSSSSNTLSLLGGYSERVC